MADDLLQAEFDRSPPGPPVPPRRSYLVCSTPRSGSTLLCEGLRATGALGTPTEYFNIEASVVPLRRRWGSASPEDFVRDLYRFRTSADGVFGAKLHWQQVEELRTDLGLDRAPNRGLMPEHQVLDGLFPGARYLYVHRADDERQAVSYWLAERTRQWSVHHGEEPPPAPLPDYDFAGIDEIRRKIEHGDACWARYFADSGIHPLRVTYEELADAYADVVARVAGELGVALGPGDVAAPRLRRQANGYSKQILDRYRDDRSRDRNVLRGISLGSGGAGARGTGSRNHCPRGTL